MSKYQPLWDWIKDNLKEEFNTITFQQVAEILGFPIDHSFLNSKKELEDYGYSIKKILIKDKKILIEKN